MGTRAATAASAASKHAENAAAGLTEGPASRQAVEERPKQGLSSSSSAGGEGDGGGLGEAGVGASPGGKGGGSDGDGGGDGSGSVEAS